MIWSSRQSGRMLIGEPKGRVDESTWESFLVAINAAIGEASQSGFGMVIDLERLDYMSSRGLRVLTLAKREAEAKQVALTLARPNERMREILAISRYDKIFAVTDSLEG
jgi:anti-sigma B factor antagonist